MRDTDSEAVSGIVVCRIVVAHVALVEAVWSVRDTGAIQAARAVTAADTAPVHHRTPTPLAGAVSRAVVERIRVTSTALVSLSRTRGEDRLRVRRAAAPDAGIVDRCHPVRLPTICAAKGRCRLAGAVGARERRAITNRHSCQTVGALPHTAHSLRSTHRGVDPRSRSVR